MKWAVIGDFGLAVARETSLTSSTDSLLEDEPSSPTNDEHTSGVGTLIYSSPEQRSKQSYNEKTDIYSLGILFFELFYCFSTKMERARVLTNLRNHVLPPDFLKENPKEVKKNEKRVNFEKSAFLLWLISPEPEDRPTVQQILKSDFLSSESVSISRLALDRMNERMREQELLIEQQQKQIAELQERLKCVQ
jgi:translation initiation factor 2-alpha kinase 1